MVFRFLSFSKIARGSGLKFFQAHNKGSVMINKARLVRLTQQLIRIHSENPPGDERAVSSFVARQLSEAGYAPKVFRYFPRRDNVSALWRGKKGNFVCLLSPHLDTVPPGNGWKVNPFSGLVRNGKIYGRGATDDKGNLAVVLEVMLSLKEDRAELEGDWLFLATADEETGSGRGLRPWLDKNPRQADFAVILDSDAGHIITSQKGLIHFKVHVPGRKAHGAYPDRGINAIDRASVLMSALKKMRFPHMPHALLKPPTINIGTIQGGDKVNMVADWCDFEVDLRFVPGLRAEKMLHLVRTALRKTGIPFRIHVSDIQEPYEISRTHPLVSCLKQAGQKAGFSPLVKGSEGATVITFFKKKGIPAVATGWGSKGCAHATDEYACIRDLVRGARQLESFIRIFDAKMSSFR